MEGEFNFQVQQKIVAFAPLGARCLERDRQSFFSLQRSETEVGLAPHYRKHCAPLERHLSGSALSINISLLWNETSSTVAPGS
jgi:hypothetical protein